MWYGLIPHAHERVVWIFAIKVTVWFHCVEWGNSKDCSVLSSENYGHPNDELDFENSFHDNLNLVHYQSYKLL